MDKRYIVRGWKDAEAYRKGERETVAFLIDKAHSTADAQSKGQKRQQAQDSDQRIAVFTATPF